METLRKTELPWTRELELPSLIYVLLRAPCYVLRAPLVELSALDVPGAFCSLGASYNISRLACSHASGREVREKGPCVWMPHVLLCGMREPATHVRPCRMPVMSVADIDDNQSITTTNESRGA